MDKPITDGEKLFIKFDNFRKQLFASAATNEEKAAIWKAFLNIYTGT